MTSSNPRAASRFGIDRGSIRNENRAFDEQTTLTGENDAVAPHVAADNTAAARGIGFGCAKQFAEFLDFSEADFDLVIRTNLKSVFLFGQAVGRHMAERGVGGSIINMASTSVKMTMPTIPAYAASKGGIASLTIAMSLSLAPRGIRVNAIGPGTIATELTRNQC